eukprot:TRINITY_DN123650_c0_g1_i1.p1 TRINITY_DN123650_c0_g1~~TRINITY_DN123650_c0_g1_i1.p1  ORF type:complete len:688 (-),score=204.28 TRINITY_DN123650_c0_g1_i1:366-2429(-)
MAVLSWLCGFVALQSIVLATEMAEQQPEHIRPPWCDRAVYEGTSKPCNNRTLVLDIGGLQVRAWCFKDLDGTPVRFPDKIFPTYKLWEGNKKSDCREDDLTWKMLKEKLDKFKQQFGEPNSTVLVVSAAVEKPGPRAITAVPKALKQLVPIAFSTFPSIMWSAVNDVTASMLGGMQYVMRWAGKNGVDEGLKVMTLNLQSNPSIGFVHRHEDHLLVAIRNSWLYGKNGADFSKLTNVGDDRKITCLKTTRRMSYSHTYEAKESMYVPALEHDKNWTLSADEEKFVSPGELMMELQKAGRFQHVGVVPFTHVLSGKNVDLLVAQDKSTSGADATSPKMYLMPDMENSHVWRQRVTQALYTFTENYEKEIACHGTNNHIVILGGNAVGLGGMLHKWVARSGANGVHFVNVITGQRQDEMPEDLFEEQGALKVESEEEPILNFGKVCKFRVHMLPYGATKTVKETYEQEPQPGVPCPSDAQGKAEEDEEKALEGGDEELVGDGKEPTNFEKAFSYPFRLGNPTTWGLEMMAGGSFLNQLEFKSEFHQSMYFPWRKAEEGGFCTDDKIIKFDLKNQGSKSDADMPAPKNPISEPAKCLVLSRMPCPKPDDSKCKANGTEVMKMCCDKEEQCSEVADDECASACDIATGEGGKYTSKADEKITWTKSKDKGEIFIDQDALKKHEEANAKKTE